MRTKLEIETEMKTVDQAVSALRQEREELPRNDDSLAARRLDQEIEDGLGRIAELNDEYEAANE